MLNIFSDANNENDYSDSTSRNGDKTIKTECKDELLDKLKPVGLSDLVSVRDRINERIDVLLALKDYRVRPFLQELFGDNSVCRYDDLIYALIAIDEVLETLTPRKEKVIKMRFGLGHTGSSHTLEEVGQHFAVTRQRIQQIEKSALKTLRHPSRSRRLKAFLREEQ